MEFFVRVAFLNREGVAVAATAALLMEKVLTLTATWKAEPTSAFATRAWADILFGLAQWAPNRAAVVGTLPDLCAAVRTHGDRVRAQGPDCPIKGNVQGLAERCVDLCVELGGIPEAREPILAIVAELQWAFARCKSEWLFNSLGFVKDCVDLLYTLAQDQRNVPTLVDPVCALVREVSRCTGGFTSAEEDQVLACLGLLLAVSAVPGHELQLAQAMKDGGVWGAASDFGTSRLHGRMCHAIFSLGLNLSRDPATAPLMWRQAACQCGYIRTHPEDMALATTLVATLVNVARARDTAERVLWVPKGDDAERVLWVLLFVQQRFPGNVALAVDCARCFEHLCGRPTFDSSCVHMVPGLLKTLGHHANDATLAAACVAGVTKLVARPTNRQHLKGVDETLRKFIEAHPSLASECRALIVCGLP
jgi:hypothetical protein